MMGQLLFLSEEDIKNILTPAKVIEIVEQVFVSVGKGEIILGKDSFLDSGTNKHNRFIAMPASMPLKGVLGLKWISIYSEPEQGYPFTHGNLIIINDIKTASPLAIVSATTLTAMRTAGGHGVVAAKYLCVKNPHTMAVIGCGNQGKNGIRGFLYQFPTLKKIKIFDSVSAAYDTIIKSYGNNVEIIPCGSPEEAVEGCQIVLTASSSSEILVHDEWIEPGTTIIGLNAFKDLDPDIATKCDKWVLGVLEEDTAGILNAADLTHGIKFNEDMVYSDLVQIISGKKAGRENEKEIILFTHMGMGAFDIACAEYAYRIAAENGIGTIIKI